jgi:hypothetical protein
LDRYLLLEVAIVACYQSQGFEYHKEHQKYCPDLVRIYKGQSFHVLHITKVCAYKGPQETLDKATTELHQTFLARIEMVQINQLIENQLLKYIVFWSATLLAISLAAINPQTQLPARTYAAIEGSKARAHVLNDTWFRRAFSVV